MGLGTRACVLAVTAMALAGCSGDRESVERQRANIDQPERRSQSQSRLSDLFGRGDSDLQINVNRHLWAAALDTLSFLPLESVDPFSGVISTGWGRANSASPVYRATVYITGPALDARSLRVAVFRRSGGGAVAVSDEVAEQIEDSILTRARQIRVAERGR